MSYYNAYGPFELPRKPGAKKKVFDGSNSAEKEFWERVEKQNKGLSKARGCYIFAMRGGGGINPWYVGQSKTGFIKECFQPAKKNQYHNVINDKKGTPILFLIARHTSIGNTFSKGQLPKNEADFVERHLIGLALRKNPNLNNIQNTAFLKKLKIQGVLNNPKGKPSMIVKELRSVLGIGK